MGELQVPSIFDRLLPYKCLLECFYYINVMLQLQTFEGVTAS